MVSQQRFTKAMLFDMGKKFEAWTKSEETADIYQKATNLIAVNVAEDDLYKHDLGDNMSAVRLAYTIIDRWNLVLLVSAGSNAIEPPTFSRNDGMSEAGLYLKSTKTH